MLKAFRTYAKLHPEVYARIELFRAYDQNVLLKAMLLIEQNTHCEAFATLTEVASAEGWLQ
jgi:hypothetical protein